jgi:hypothetical protein
MASTGRLHTPVAKIFDVGEARAAYQTFSGRTGRGRIVSGFPGRMNGRARGGRARIAEGDNHHPFGQKFQLSERPVA